MLTAAVVYGAVELFIVGLLINASSFKKRDQQTRIIIYKGSNSLHEWFALEFMVN